MMDKQSLLNLIRAGLQQGAITPQDLQQFIPPAATPASQQPASNPPVSPTVPKINGVNLLFYAAGIILFAALMTLLAQMWADTNIAIKLIATAGVGLGSWTLASFLQDKHQEGLQQGLVNTFVMLGSLSIIAFIPTTLTIIGDKYENIPVTMVVIASILIALVGGLFVLYDRILHHIALIMVGSIMLTFSFVPAAIAVLEDHGASLNISLLPLFAAAWVLYNVGGVVAKTGPDRTMVRPLYASLAAFVALATLFALSFSTGTIAFLWQAISLLIVYGTFYLSIKQRNRYYLFVGTTFLILISVTFSFRYFSGLGAALSLVIAAVCVLASAFVAATINTKYLKA